MMDFADPVRPDTPATLDLSSPTEVENLVKKLRMDAEMRRDNAARGGGRDDGGASHMEREIEVWLAGRAWTLPSGSWWEDAAAQTAAELDPEWEDYKRLHERFGGAKP